MRGERRMSRELSVAAIGRLAALASATSFAGVSMFAGFVYSGGATPASVIAARLLFGLFGTFAVVAYLRRPWMVPAREWRPTLVIATAWLAVNVCYMASFYYIPVSLAVLIFFTFPVQVPLIGPLLARRRPEPVTLGAALSPSPASHSHSVPISVISIGAGARSRSPRPSR